MSDESSRLRRFIAELRRRRVFRVASFYVVAAWAVIEVSATILPALGLDEWLVTVVVVAALGGFPVALVLAWMFDMTGEGLERTDAYEAGAGRLHRAPWLRPVVAVGLIAVVLAGAWFYASVMRTPDARAERSSVAVFPFHVQGSASLAYLREGMASLLSTNLNGAGSHPQHRSGGAARRRG